MTGRLALFEPGASPSESDTYHVGRPGRVFVPTRRVVTALAVASPLWLLSQAPSAAWSLSPRWWYWLLL